MDLVAGQRVPAGPLVSAARTRRDGSPRASILPVATVNGEAKRLVVGRRGSGGSAAGFGLDKDG